MQGYIWYIEKFTPLTGDIWDPPEPKFTSVMNNSVDHNNEFFDPDSFREDEFKAWIKTQPEFIKFYGHPASLKRLQARLSHYKNGLVELSSERIGRNILIVTKSFL